MPPRPDVSTERRAQIIEAALACFKRKGFNNTTMDDIVTESGLSKGSLYWYFKSKDELFTAALMSIFTNIGEDTVSAVAECTTASDRLRALGRAATDASRLFEGYFGLLLEFWASSLQREETGQFWMSLIEQYKDIVVEIIDQGIRDGELRSVDAEALVWALLAAYDGLAAYAMFMPGLDLDRISQTLVETVLAGLQVEE
jgi:AcrR family transcriptional regulator